MWKNYNLSQSKSEHKFLLLVFCISKNIKQFFFEIIMIALSHSVCIKCYKITFFTYSFLSMFAVATLSSRFSMDNVVWDFHWLVPGLKINIDDPNSRVLQILKSLLSAVGLVVVKQIILMIQPFWEKQSTTKSLI